MARIPAGHVKKSFLDQIKVMAPSVIMAQGRGVNKDMALQLIGVMRNRGRPKAKPNIGKLYYYQYDAKLKDQLPYWDMFPVMIPIKYYPDGWLGLNLHYLDMYNRAALMDRLIAGYSMGKREYSRLAISYQIMKGVSELKAFKPCLKRYLASHVKSQPIEIDRRDWMLAATLPLAKFQGASESKVHRDSLKAMSA